jgi:UDPglucose 6-dehydrogenase
MMGRNSKVCIIGLWHLGSVVSACLADLGYLVVGVDKDPRKVADLNNGIPPLFEPGLEALIQTNIKQKRLSYTTDLGSAAKGAGYILITFDTPVDDKDEVDLSEIFAASRELAKYLDNGSVIIVSSQVPVGTCEQIKQVIKQGSPSMSFDIACSPENLRLGQAIEVFKNPERIVIGADSPITLDKVEQFFAPVAAPVVRMNLRTAEMTKHALNAFLATSISFANEIANLCDEVGADALKVAEALRSDSRIGQKARLLPGLGFAGGTLARDIKVLQKLGQRLGYETHLLNGVLKVNEQQNKLVIRKLKKVYGSLKGLTVGVLGLTYKPGTSTLRRSAALEIISDLADEGAIVRAHDPKADSAEIRLHHEFEFYPDPYQVAEGADALVIVTEWLEFKSLNYDLIKTMMKKPVLIDTKNLLDDMQMLARGFSYFGVGRGKKYDIGR